MGASRRENEVEGFDYYCFEKMRQQVISFDGDVVSITTHATSRRVLLQQPHNIYPSINLIFEPTTHHATRVVYALDSTGQRKGDEG